MEKVKKKKRKKLLFGMMLTHIISVSILFLLLTIIAAVVIKRGDLVVDFPVQNENIEFPNDRFHTYMKLPPYFYVVILICFSLIVGLSVSVFLSKSFLKPVNKLKESANKVAKGNFNVQIEGEDRETEIGELICDFNTMVLELQKNEMLKNDFISNVSHEFKTPLSVIQGYTTLLQEPNLSNEDKEKYTSAIIESTTKLTTLVNNILKISKIDNMKISLEKEYFQLDEQIREVILNLEKEWESKNIELDIDLDEIMIHGNQQLLGNVWSNLISNAIKFSYSNSKIEISLKKENSYAKIIVKDYGCAIDEQDLPYIFDKFYQGDKSHSKEGNGLGLTLAKKIVSISNGKINVESTIGKGSKFVVYLPLK